MNDSKTKTVHDADIGDFDAWHAKVGQTVAEHGFLNAWEQHFREILHVHHSKTFLNKLLASALHSLLLQDPELRDHFEQLPKKLTKELKTYLKEKAKGLDVFGWMRKTFGGLFGGPKKFKKIKEAEGKTLLCFKKRIFENWGRTVKNKPYLTAIPRTKQGVCNLVKWAESKKKTIRVSGYRHTWSNLYSSNDQVLISMLPLDVVEELPASAPGIDPDNELQGIEIVGQIEEDGLTKALCKIGAATTNEQFRRWCLDEQGGQWNWTIPLSVIMVEITYGGSNAPICHGAGLRNQTLGDLVTEIEFVNAKGKLQIVDDPELLKVAAGCFGLLGVVTSLTLKLDPMTYAVMKPIKPRVGLTIPPPKGFTVPEHIDMSGISEQDMEKAWQDFVDHCENDYYSEWFWFPYRQNCWVHCWKNNGKREDAQEYPGEIGTLIQQAEEYLGELMNTTLFKLLPG